MFLVSESKLIVFMVSFRTFTTAAEFKVQGSPNSIHFNPTYNNIEAATCSYLVTASIRVGKQVQVLFCATMLST